MAAGLKQAKPEESSWIIWRKALKLISTKRKLHVKLGNWFYAHTELQRDWVYYYDPKNYSLYQRQNNIIQRHKLS